MGEEALKRITNLNSPKPYRYRHQGSSHTAEKDLGPTSDFLTWGSAKGTGTP